jgi:hypothetical protein
MRLMAKRVGEAVVLSGVAVAGSAMVPGTSEAHCGHGCGGEEVITESFCYDGYWWHNITYYEWNMLGTKNDFQGCDTGNYERACLHYAWWVQGDYCT